MDKKKTGRFNGFSTSTLDFLTSLGANNNKPWFEAHKQDYRKHLLEPLQYLVMDLGEFMLSIDPYLEISPQINRTISRIYRDTRFSHDKSPYKTTMWVTFKRPVKEWQNAPAYFFEITSESYRYGMGFYCACKDKMDKFREIINQRPQKFQEAISFYSKQRTFVIEGEKYKRILDKTKSSDILEWYQRKNLYLVCNRNIDEPFFIGKLVDDLISGFGLIAPFYHHLLNL